MFQDMGQTGPDRRRSVVFTRDEPLVLGEVTLAILGELTTQELWCAGQVVVELNRQAAGSMAMSASIYQANVADSPMVPPQVSCGSEPFIQAQSIGLRNKKKHVQCATCRTKNVIVCTHSQSGPSGQVPVQLVPGVGLLMGQSG